MSQISVPNTNTFRLQDVVDAVQPSANTLDQCFEEAVDEYFNETYKGDKNRLYNFRDYKFTPIACSIQASYPGGQDYPSTEIVTLGTDTGTVEFHLMAYTYPDLGIVTYDGNIVINTGYIGSSNYSYGGISRSSFRWSLNGRVDPITGETFPYTSGTFPSHIEPDGYPVVIGVGHSEWIVHSFSKSKIYPTQAQVKIYAPMSGTAWTFKLGCPGDSL